MFDYLNIVEFSTIILYDSYSDNKRRQNMVCTIFSDKHEVNSRITVKNAIKLQKRLSYAKVILSYYSGSRKAYSIIRTFIIYLS